MLLVLFISISVMSVFKNERKRSILSPRLGFKLRPTVHLKNPEPVIRNEKVDKKNRYDIQQDINVQVSYFEKKDIL